MTSNSFKLFHPLKVNDYEQKADRDQLNMFLEQGSHAIKFCFYESIHHVALA